jgi:hypothetical protein
MPSLWLPSSWSQRLAELTSPSSELKVAPLRRDVRSLGMLLGAVLREQAAPGIYEAVEALRQAAIARRDDEDGAALEEPRDLAPVLARVHEQAEDPTRAYQLARASASTSSSSTWPRPTTASAAAWRTSWKNPASQAPGSRSSAGLCAGRCEPSEPPAFRCRKPCSCSATSA